MKDIRILQKTDVDEMIANRIFSLQNYVLKELNKLQIKVNDLDRIIKTMGEQ